MMLAGNIGGGAINVLSGHGIDVVRGCSGNVREVVQNWITGNLVDSGMTCRQHEHKCND